MVVLLGLVGLVIGWKIFWFLCDDAFIAFRYVSNRRLGFGYVWNAPPFLPVEGYTSFLWVVLLDATWALTGLEPPESANLISLGFSAATLCLVALAVWRQPLGDWLGRRRVLIVFCSFAYLLLNRTFLAWSSSGLETAMFNFLLLAWIVVLVSPGRPERRLALGSWATVALALTRPDGLLYAAAFLAIVWVSARHAVADGRVRRKLLLLGCGPLLVLAAHLLWRHGFYGEWLPNTYAAKVIGVWPESGLRYALSFVLEYGLWFPALIVAGKWLGFGLAERSGLGACRRRPLLLGSPGADRQVRWIVLGAVVIHLLYYTLVVGGDVFEYRVYSYVPVLVALVLVRVLALASAEPSSMLVAVAATIFLSLPIPWTHWFATRHLANTRPSPASPIAPIWPAMARWYVVPFDTAQRWLIAHNVCMRHHDLKQFVDYLLRVHPTRAEGARTPADGYPIAAAHAVGVASWIAPHVAIIDLLGLNDYVIARTPIPPGRERQMAHSRRPPAGYVEGFRPNVFMEDGVLRVAERRPPLTADEIRSHESEWRERVRAQDSL